MFKNLSIDALGLSGTQNEAIELALSNGFRGIDLDLVDFHRQVQARGLPHARRLIDSAKLKIGSFQLPIDLEAEDADFRAALEKLPELAKLAAEIGCTRAATTLAPASDLRPYHQNFEFWRKRFAEVAAVLEEHSIRLGVGFLAAAERREGKAFQFIHQLDAMLMLLNLVNRRNIGVSLDLWQLHVAGGGIDEVRKLPVEQIVTVQLADIPADLDRQLAKETARLLPGETGVIEASAVLVSLAERGYDGPVTPWPDRSQLQGVRRDEVAKRAGQAMDSVWKGAGLSPAGKLAAAARK
jgi:sugar phosphate isomerase/epimerase